jgi:hypothetical protein|tara:strand:+ start:1496 stop:1687 length:192 start_codon:yes stop_codon:yes gene_type:complete
MKSVWEEDTDTINHITYVSNSVQDLANELYEDLMDRDHDNAILKSKEVVKILQELIESLEDEI